MARWFSKKKPQEDIRVLEFNSAKLNIEIQNLSTRLGAFDQDIGVAVVEEVIQLARNLAILELGQARDEKDFQLKLGRRQALSDLADYIARSKAAKPKEEKEKKSRDALRPQFRRTDNQAGAAI